MLIIFLAAVFVFTLIIALIGGSEQRDA